MYIVINDQIKEEEKENELSYSESIACLEPTENTEKMGSTKRDVLGESSAHNIRSTVPGTSELTAKGMGPISFNIRPKVNPNQENFDAQMNAMTNNMQSIKI